MRKKILTGALVLAAAAVVSIAGSKDASAALTADKVTVDANTQTLTVTGAECKEIGFSVATVNAKGIIKSAADAAWEWHDGASATIDLSTLSNTKDNYVQLKSEADTDVITIKIPAVNAKVKAVYDAAANKVEVQDITDKKAPVAVTGTVEFKNKYGNWTTYTDAAMASYVYKGASLTFRVAADTATAIAAAGENDTVIKNAATDETGITYYIAKAFPGKEVKVSVKKLANGPKVAANYVKNTITVPKGAEYRINGAALGEWTQPEDSTKALNLDAATVAATAGTIEVRTAAVKAEGTKAGKPASKISRLGFDAISPLTVTASTEGVTDVNELLAIQANAVKGDVAKATLKQGETTLPITVEYVMTEDKKTHVKSATAIKITNTSKDAYQVYVNKDADGNAPAIGVKGAVAVGAATFNKDGEMTKAKEVTIKNCNGAEIYITKVGNAKDKVWATPFVGLGTVKYPADVVPEPDPTVAPTETPTEE